PAADLVRASPGPLRQTGLRVQLRLDVRQPPVRLDLRGRLLEQARLVLLLLGGRACLRRAGGRLRRLAGLLRRPGRLLGARRLESVRFGRLERRGLRRLRRGARGFRRCLPLLSRGGSDARSLRRCLPLLSRGGSDARSLRRSLPLLSRGGSQARSLRRSRTLVGRSSSEARGLRRSWPLVVWSGSGTRLQRLRPP